MVSFGLLVGAALAGVYNWASGVYSYNRDAWMTDIQVEQAHAYQEDNLQIQLKSMQREEVRDLVNSDLNRINNSLLVATLILSLAGEMLFEGQIPTDCPAFVLNAYILCLGSAVFHLSFCILFGICASSKAYRRASSLLTRFIRPQWKEQFQKMKTRKATENTATFESRPLSRMMMPPLASRMFGKMRRAEDQNEQVSPTFTGTWSDHSSTSEGFVSPQRFPRRWRQSRSLGKVFADESLLEFEDLEAKLEAKEPGRPSELQKHVTLWKDTSQAWRKFSSCMFKCLARGTMNLLEACGYLAVGTLYGGYAEAWAFWAIQLLFTVINVMIVRFLLDSFEPTNIKSDWLIWILRRYPLVVACIVASGPLFCVIAAATSWVIMDRFLIPLCYGTHTFVNVYFVSMFTTDDDIQEKHHDSDSENEEEGICAVEGQEWGPWVAQPLQPNERLKVDFLPVQMLRQGTYVVNFLWSCAFLWALYGAWFGMDFRNSKAAVSLWTHSPPQLELSQEFMASPSAFWKPHALVCPRNQVFVADRYHVYELEADNTRVKRYPCVINGTIADIAATCNEKSCWPVVLLQGTPPLVLDCSTGRQDPLLQTTSDAGRIATDAGSMPSGKLQTLLATVGDKEIVQYGWSVERGAWEPLWDIESTVGVLSMDLVLDRLLVFHRGGYLQSQDIKSGRLCSTWAFDESDSVIGGGCGNQESSSILILVKKGRGTVLMRANLPALDDCNGQGQMAGRTIGI